MITVWKIPLLLLHLRLPRKGMETAEALEHRFQKPTVFFVGENE